VRQDGQWVRESTAPFFPVSEQDMLDQDLEADVAPERGQLQATARMKMKATGGPLHRLFFRLGWELQIDSFRVNGQDVKFRKIADVVEVTLPAPAPAQSGDVLNLEMHYAKSDAPLNPLVDEHALEAIYARGGYLFVMLEARLGKAALLEILKLFCTRSMQDSVADQEAMLRDLQAALSQSADEGARAFVADWMRGAKRFDPALLALEQEPAGETWRVRLQLEHRGGLQFPVPIRLALAGSTIRIPACRRRRSGRWRWTIRAGRGSGRTRELRATSCRRSSIGCQPVRGCLKMYVVPTLVGAGEPKSPTKVGTTYPPDRCSK